MTIEFSRFGMFSEKAAAIYGTHIWRKPDGGEIEITGALDDPDPTTAGYLWPDAVFVGEVTGPIRRNRPKSPEQQMMDDMLDEMNRRHYREEMRRYPIFEDPADLSPFSKYFKDKALRTPYTPKCITDVKPYWGFSRKDVQRLKQAIHGMFTPGVYSTPCHCDDCFEKAVTLPTPPKHTNFRRAIRNQRKAAKNG